MPAGKVYSVGKEEASMKSPVRCPACRKVLKNAQGLGCHIKYCKRMNHQAVPQQDQPAPEKTPAMAERQELVWDTKWGPVQKEAAILNSLGLDWGIDRRGGQWTAVPMIGTGMKYHAAVLAADRWNAIARLPRLLPPRRRPAPEPVEETGNDDLLLALLLTTRN
jgi:phage FluMu protein Com